jgi:uncharacterized protein YecE (DUF72 family)
MAAPFDIEDARAFLDRAPRDFPEWECRLEEWSADEILAREG